MAAKDGRRRRRVRKYRGLRKRWVRAGRKVGRIGVATGSGTHWFKERTQLLSIGVAPGANATGVMTFKLTDLLNANNFVALFDLYKLKKVSIKLVPLVNSSDASTGTNAAGQVGTLPMLFIAPNHDPYVPPPATVGDVLNDDGCRVIRLDRPTTLTISNPKPNIVDNTGDLLPIMFNTKTQPWLTTGGNSQIIDQSGVPHYGFRYVLTNNAVADLTVGVYATYYFCMKEQD